MADITGSKTSANPLVFDPDPLDNFNYDIIPLITAGDRVSLITGAPLASDLTTSPTELFTMVNTPDGLGLKQIDGLNYVWMNHELGSSTVTPLGSGQIQGARVSLFVFDENWNAVGGKNLIETVKLGEDTYTLNTATGFYENGSSEQLSFSRFCSGYLAETGFVGSNSLDVPMWFMGEEDDTVDSNNGGNGYGLGVSADGTATIIAGLGKYKKETVVAHTSYRADNSDYTVLISSEDNADGEVYLYVGKQTADNPNGFWSDAGADGSNFALYVLRVVDSQGNVFNEETMPEDQELIAQWVEVPDAIALGSATDLSNWVNGTNAQGVFRSTDFERPEDTALDPNDPNTFYFTTTGSGADNPNGKVHKFTVSLDADGKPIDGTFENLFVSGPNTASRYDNLVADSNGNLVVQTDGNSPEVGILYDIDANANNVGNDRATPIYQLNVSGESSGVIEVSGETQVPGQSSYLIDVQSTNGQLILLEPTTEEPPDRVNPTINFLLDQSGSDFNKIKNGVLLTESQNDFQFQLSDDNSGIDPTSVTSSTITITKDGVPLTESVDYTFAYDSSTELITVTSLNDGFTNGQYEIAASNIADNEGNQITPSSFTVDINTELQLAAFQQGSGGYTGTVDTQLEGGKPDENFSTFDELNVDGSSGGFPVQSLIRFEDIFGSNSGQIPLNAEITSASLQLQVTNPGNQLEFYKMVSSWSDADTWNSFGDGIQTDGTEAATTPVGTTEGDVETGLLSVNVTSSVREWQADPTTNNGWAIMPTGTNGVDFYSAEGTTPPTLVIEYSVNNTPVATNDSYFVDEDTRLRGNVLLNDSDPDGDSLYVSAVNGSAAVVGSKITLKSGSKLTMNADGTFKYNPDDDLDDEGISDRFTYTVSDGNGASDTATVTFSMTDDDDDGDDKFFKGFRNDNYSKTYSFETLDRAIWYGNSEYSEDNLEKINPEIISLIDDKEFMSLVQDD